MAAKFHMRLCVARVLVACALFGLGAGAHAVEIRAERAVQPAPAFAPAPKARVANPAQVARVTLARLAPAAAEKSLAPAAKLGSPLQIGFSRAVSDLESASSTVARLRWSAAASGGQLAAFSITSPDALAIRAGLRFESLPAGTLLRFYAPGAGDVVEVTAEAVRAVIGRNLDAGGQGEDAGTYWSPVIEGPTAVVEIELGRGVSPTRLALAAPRVSHWLTAPSIDFAMTSTKAAAGCNLDVTCSSDWASESNAVARITFVDAGSSYLCTGTLVADKDPATAIPYFLTANHCVTSQTVASTLVSYWFYRSASCNSATRAAAQTLNGGATLLYASADTDTAFMRLNGTPPAGAVYAGWVVGGAGPAGANVVSLHNPTGDLQKISFGSVAGYDTCSAAGSESFGCRGSAFGAATFYEVAWRSGITEPGSSGAGVFLENGHYLLGQLYGGSTSCSALGSDFYGRFDTAYNAGLRAFLDNAATPANPAGPAAPALDYSALWWNPAESGWGLSITQHGSTLFAAWFIYEAGGNARWVVIPGGAWTSATTFSGDVYYTSGPASGVPWSAVSSQRAGNATLSFSGANAGVLAYTVNGYSGTKSIQRQPFGVPDATPAAGYGDLWWNAAEPGWGLSINQQYRTLFAVWYTYGLYGQPVWYVMPGGSWSGDTYTGTLYRTTIAPGEFLDTPFDPRAVRSAAVGSMVLRFANPSAATMSYTVDGVSGSKAITREPF